MADPLQPFMNSIRNKIYEMKNKNNEDLQKQLEIIKQVFTMILSPEGRTYIAREERFRNILIRKIEEFADRQHAQNDIQFVALSRNLKTVIENILRGQALRGQAPYNPQ